MGRRLLAVARLVEIDGLRRGEIHRPAAVTVVPGGKGLNVARVAAELGAPVTAVGFLGGHAGRWIETLGRYSVGSRDAFPVASVATLRGDDRRAVVVLGTAAAAASALVPGARRLEAAAVKHLCFEIAAERVG
jgi:hypothetical protein